VTGTPPAPERAGLVAGLRRLARFHPWAFGIVWTLALGLAAFDVLLVSKRIGYVRETSRLRAGLSGVERTRLDAALEADSNRVQLIIALARRQASVDDELHLSISLDSAHVALEQGGAVLRVAPADIGPDAWVRTGRRDSLRITAPRGTRTIEQVLDDTAVVLSGGALIYAHVAADTATHARPGSVRIGAGDLRAITPNLKPGQRVYFY